MSHLFHEPFEPALYVRDRPFAPRAKTTAAVTSFNGARRRLADAFFEVEAQSLPRRRFSQGHAAPPPAFGPGFPSLRRQLAMFAVYVEDAWSDPPARSPRRFGGVGFTLSNGRTASFTVRFTGQASDDPYADEAFAAAATSGLAADPNQALAVQTSGNFTGATASRRG